MPIRLHKRRLFSSVAPAPVPATQPKKKGGFFRWVGRRIRGLCTFLGAIFLLSFFISAFVGGMLADDETPVLPNAMILRLTLEGDYAEHRQFESYGYGAASDLTFREVIDTLDRAQTDARVKGIAAKMKEGGFSLAQIEELRRAIKRFRATGKFAHIYAESWGPETGGMGAYYLATGFGEIWMQPVGNLYIPGIGIEAPYARALLDRLGIAPQFFARKEYKNIFESFTATEMGEASREAAVSLVGDLAAHMLDDMASDRKLAKEELTAQIDKGLLTDDEALAAKLIDRLDYASAFEQEARKKSGKADEVKFVTLRRYADDVMASHTLPVGKGARKPGVALVYITGAIMSSSDDTDMFSESVAGADDIAKAINGAARDDDYKVIVVRIDSPGGSPSASETIRHALVNAKEKGKKVIVSMGGMAASGGYWVAAPADYIYAMPMTLTGSIGVAGGKFALEEFWKKADINWSQVTWGENAGLWSLNQPLTPAQAERMNAIFDDIYNDFTSVVAAGRMMNPAQVERVARGRVWTGAQAKNNGLVDALGTLNDALDYAAVQAGAKDRHGVAITELPEPRSPFDELLKLLELQAGMARALSWQGAVMEKITPLLPQAAGGQWLRADVRLQP